MRRKKKNQGEEVVAAVVLAAPEPKPVWPTKAPAEAVAPWRITADGADLGTYEATSRAAALDAFARACGYASAADADKQVGPFSGEITPVAQNPKPPTYEQAHWGLQPAGTERLDIPDLNQNTGFTAYGELVEVTYRTKKKGDWAKTDYVHKFQSERPLLCYGDKDGRLYIAGGSYKVEARGIVG